MITAFDVSIFFMNKTISTTVEYTAMYFLVPSMYLLVQQLHKRLDSFPILLLGVSTFAFSIFFLLLHALGFVHLIHFAKAYYIFDTIISQYTEGKEDFQKIVNKLGVNQNELLEDCFKFFDLDLIGKGKNNDSELCLHSMSPIFDRLIKWMDAKIDKDNNVRLETVKSTSKMNPIEWTRSKMNKPYFL